MYRPLIKNCQTYPKLTGFMLALLIGSLIQIIVGNVNLINGLSLWLLALIMSLIVLAHLSRECIHARISFTTAWIFLLFALTTSLFLHRLNFNPCYFFAFNAISFFCWDRNIAIKNFFIISVVTLLIPFQNIIYDIFAFPLSSICSTLTTFTLNLFGITAESHFAVITLGNDRIAVTAACSGIELLEPMLLLSFIIVYLTQRKLLWRLTHLLLFIPILVIANSLRLLIVSLLYLMIGNEAFNVTLHALLGMGVIIIVITFMIIVGYLFKEDYAQK